MFTQTSTARGNQTAVDARVDDKKYMEFWPDGRTASTGTAEELKARQQEIQDLFLAGKGGAASWEISLGSLHLTSSESSTHARKKREEACLTTRRLFAPVWEPLR